MKDRPYDRMKATAPSKQRISDWRCRRHSSMVASTNALWLRDSARGCALRTTHSTATRSCHAGCCGSEHLHGPRGVYERTASLSNQGGGRCCGIPPILMHHKDGAAVAPSGWTFPPFTVAERGQPLDAWIASYTADIVESEYMYEGYAWSGLPMHSRNLGATCTYAQSARLPE